MKHTYGVNQEVDKLRVFDVDTVEVLVEYGGTPMSKDYVGFLKMLSKRAIVLLKEFNT